MSEESGARLHPAQVCFVVDDVSAAVGECVERFGWGPFHEFTAPVPEARYHDWQGAKQTEVALGMAGRVQVELIHVSAGHDTVEAYQARYGPGFQHLGIHCRDRDLALASLEKIGAALDDEGEYPGVRFAFVDTPTGPGMFELLEATGDTPPPGDGDRESERPAPSVAIDRATIVTDDLEQALAFYAEAFGWKDAEIETQGLRVGSTQTEVRRVRGRAGQLTLELVEPRRGSDDLYARHLERGDHGLVHAGGVATDAAVASGGLQGEWLADGETFTLLDWSGGAGALQVRGART